MVKAITIMVEFAITFLKFHSLIGKNGFISILVKIIPASRQLLHASFKA